MRYGLETPFRLIKPTTCFWCGGSLRNLKNIFKGQNSSHEYCSENCLKRGLDREIRYKATLAGQVNSPWHLAAAGILLLFVIGFLGTPRARAQSHHDFHKDFYRNWVAPDNPSKSCCNARINTFGVESGDCEPTEARVVNGYWHAWVRQKKEWLRIPDEKIVRYPNPNIFDSHLCWTPQSGIICFRPADTGG